MADGAVATTPEEEEELLLRAYYQAQSAPPGQRVAAFQEAAPVSASPDEIAAQLAAEANRKHSLLFGTSAPASTAPAPVMRLRAAPTGGAPSMVAPGSVGLPAEQRYSGPPAAGAFAPPGSAAAAAAATPTPAGAAAAPAAPVRVGTTTVESLGVKPAPVRQAARPPADPGRAALHAAIRQDIGSADEGRLLPHKVGLTVKPMLPGEEQQLSEAEDEGFRAQVEQGEAQIQSAQDIAAKAVEHADQQEAIDQQFAERELERQSMLRDREIAFSDMIDKTLSEPIENPSLFGEGAGEQILNRLSVFLGQIGAAPSGGPNLAYEKLQKDMEKTLMLQKEKRARGVERLKMQPMLIDMARERFKSEAAVDTVMREAAYRKLGAELERFKEFAKTPERRAGLDAMIAQNNAQLTNLAIQRRQAMDADVLRERQILAAQRAGGVDPRKQLLGKLKTEVGIKKATEELTGTGSSGEVTAGQKGGAVLDLKQKESALRRLEDLNNQLKNKSKLTDPFQRDSVKQQMVDTWAVLEGKKQMTKEEQESAGKALFSGASATDTVDQYISGYRREVDRQRRAVGSLKAGKEGGKGASDD